MSNLLPIFTSPCYMCTWFRPKHLANDILMCHKGHMLDTFDCLETRFPFNIYTVEDIIINPKYLKVKFKEEVNEQELVDNGWELVDGWWICVSR